MTTGKLIYLIVFGPAILVIIGIPIILMINGIKKKREKHTEKLFSVIKQYSQKYNDLVEMAHKYRLHSDIPKSCKFTYRCNSKYAFDKDNKHKIVLIVATTNPEVDELYYKLTENRENKPAFIAESRRVKETPENSILISYLPHSLFIEYEDKLCSQFIDSIREDVRIMISLSTVPLWAKMSVWTFSSR